MKKVIIAGAGPGAADLITLRGKKAIEKADIIIYAGSLVNPELLKYAHSEAQKINSANLNLDEVVQIVKEAYFADKQVLRLHTGDPAMYGAISEQMNAFDKAGIEYEVIPGVSSIFAAAAELKCELTMPGISQSAILTRRAGRTPVPLGEEITKLAANGATVAVFLSVSDMHGLVDDFYQAGRTPDTPAAVVYRASWPNQKIVKGTLGDIADKVAAAGIKRQAMIIVGETLNRNGDLSLLYDVDFAHGYRDAGAQLWNDKKTAIYALTNQGKFKAAEIAGGMNNATVFAGKNLDDLLEENWHNFDTHIFIMASGIVIRKIGKFLIDKISDPAVVCCDELGDFVVSLIGGHIGGANLLAQKIAGITGGKAVISTASDINNLTAIDLAATLEGFRIINPDCIKEINRRMLEQEPIEMLVPEDFFNKFCKKTPHVKLIKDTSEIQSEAVVSFNCAADVKYNLRLTNQGINIGIGCRRGTCSGEIEDALKESLSKLDCSFEDINCIASFSAKRNEKGLIDFVKKHRIRIKFFSKDTLNQFEVPNPTKRAQEEFGVNSVCEASALALGGKLVLEKQKLSKVTVAVSREEL